MPRPLPNPSAKRSRAGSKRRAAGWMLLSLGLLVAGVWVWSGWNKGELALSRRGIWRWTIACSHGNVLARVNYWSYPHDWALPMEETSKEQTNAPLLPVLTWRSERISASPAYSLWGWDWEDTLITHVGHRREWSAMGWPLPLLLWTTGGLALWSGRRARRRALEGHCPTCGYNLAGLNRDAGGVCPECGTVRSGAERMNAGS